MIPLAKDSTKVVVCTVGLIYLGINVVNIKEIVKAVKVTRLPRCHESVDGIVEIRGEVVPVISLSKIFGYSKSPEAGEFILAENEKVRIILHVHKVEDIYSFSSAEVEAPGGNRGFENKVLGVVTSNERDLLLLDVEKIINTIHINPAYEQYLYEKRLEEKTNLE